MKWTEVKVKTASEAVEAISNVMMEAGVNGVAIEDVLDIEDSESDLYGGILDKERSTHVKEGTIVMAYFPETTFLPEILPFMKENVLRPSEYGLPIGKNEMAINGVAESDRAAAQKKYYRPVRVTRFLVTVPSWGTYHAQGRAEKIIMLDPGMAFGTGAHPTTRLTLQALETVLCGGEIVLDIGTGSGVLSIAGRYLGAKDAYTYGLGGVVVAVTKENMGLNPIVTDVHVSANDPLKGISHSTDIIVASVLADTIVLVIEDTQRLLKQDGTFIISRIIEGKKATALEALTKVDFVVDQLFNQSDWYATILKKPEEE